MNRAVALFILVFFVVQIVQANLGPGIDIDPTWATQIKVAEDGTGYWHTNHIRIVFNSNITGACMFYSGYGATVSGGTPPYGAIRFYLERNGTVLAERTFTVYGEEYFSTRQLFNAAIEPGEYVLGIQLLPRDANSFLGAVLLLGYSTTTDPSTTYYYHIFAEGWIEGDYDIAWYAACNQDSSSPPSSPTPQIIIRDVRLAGDKVNVSIVLSGFRPNSAVEVYYVDLYGYTAGGMPLIEKHKILTVNINASGAWSGSVYVDGVSEEDWLEARGYDINGNYVAVESNKFNVTLKAKDWLSVATQIFNALFAYMHLAFSVVVALVPYAGIIYVLSFVGVVYKCMRELSLSPLFDFFYRQYMMLVNLAQLIIKIAEKLYEGAKTLIEWIVKIIGAIV